MIKLPLSSIFVTIPILVLLFGLSIGVNAGTYVAIYLVGIVSCLPSIAFSVGWSKWLALALAVIFAVLIQMDHDQGMNRIRERYQKLREAKAN